MDNDILKDYFSQQNMLLNTEPDNEFEKRLKESLNRRICRLERRRKFCSILSLISFVLMNILLINYYLPFKELSLRSCQINISPIFMLLSSILFVMIFVVSYLVGTMKLRVLKQQYDTIK